MSTTREDSWPVLRLAFVVFIFLLAHAVPVSGSCVITDETNEFFVTSIQRATNGVVTVFQSCPDHLYELYSADSLSSQTVYTLRATMIGLDGTTSYTDTNAASVMQRFYKVGRVTSTTDTD